MMNTLCIFTPTYNRRDYLMRCYESLIAQTCKDFTWQIIDDGSNDDTENLVMKWIMDGCISIGYYYQDNAGKIKAMKRSLLLCQEELWMCLDSDDYLFENAVEIILNNYRKIEKKESVAGMIAVRSNKQGFPMQGEKFQKKVELIPEYLRFIDFRYKYKIPPEYIQIYKTKIIKRFSYPDFEGEKFMPESSSYCLIDKSYKLLKIIDALMVSIYQEDGLTKNHSKIVRMNPKGYTYTHAVIVECAPTIRCFIHSAICYQMGRYLGGDRYKFSRYKAVMVTLFKPLGFIAKRMLYR